MIKASRNKWAIAGAFLLLAGLYGAWLVSRDTLFLASISSPATFKTENEPAPDYAMTETWVSKPEPTPPGAWESPWGVDVFFVHPTTAYTAHGRWNATIDAAAARDRLESEIFPAYGQNLEGAGPVYAPRYRQAILSSVLRYSPAGAKALDLAYQDVEAAFDQYLAHDNNRRAIMLAGVEQGGLHIARLLQERFNDPSLRELLVGAYLIDTPISKDSLSIPVCNTASETGCAVIWQMSRSRLASSAKDRAQFPTVSATGEFVALGKAESACVNPLSWTTGSGLAPASAHVGGATQFSADGEATAVLDKQISAQCVNGLLEVSCPKDSRLRKGGLCGWGQKFIRSGSNLFYADIAANAVNRSRTLSAWLDDNGRKPARPLPPIRPLDEAPIHREGDQARPL